MAHEATHVLLHKCLYAADPNQRTFGWDDELEGAGCTYHCLERNLTGGAGRRPAGGPGQQRWRRLPGSVPSWDPPGWWCGWSESKAEAVAVLPRTSGRRSQAARLSGGGEDFDVRAAIRVNMGVALRGLWTLSTRPGRG